MILDIAAVLAGVVLAGVFAVAGAAKQRDRAAAIETVEAFGVPGALAPVTAVVVSLTELAVAVLLVIGPTRAVGAGAALALLSLFSVAVGASLARGESPVCHCFGQLSSTPVSARTLARNAGLALLAGTVLLAGPVTLSGGTLLIVAAAAAIAALLGGAALAVVALVRSQGRLLLRLDAVERGLDQAGIDVGEQPTKGPGPEPGTAAPAFTAEALAGTAGSLGDLLAPGLPLLLVFTSPDCGPCRKLMPQLGGWQHEHAEHLTIAVVTGGDRDAAQVEAREHGLAHALDDEQLELHRRYEIAGTPSAVLVAADGTIDAYMAEGPGAIEGLVDRVLQAGRSPGQGALAVGAPAPDLELGALDGEAIALDTATLLVFWNPGCGFCSSMRDDLLAWERTAPADAPQLVVVSSGDEEATRAEGFAGPVALDPGMRVGAAFGALGTPMAVLLDDEGRVASPLAAGAAAVLSLAGAPLLRVEQVGR